MNPKSPTYRFRRVWGWPHHVEKMVAGLIEGYSLHVCCGGSDLGDVRVDIVQSDLVKPNIRASMFHLPFRRSFFDTVICDPPWHIPYHVRFRLLREVRDVLRPGGKLVWNCFWMPRVRGLEIDWDNIWCGWSKSAWRNVSLIVIAHRSALA